MRGNPPGVHLHPFAFVMYRNLNPYPVGVWIEAYGLIQEPFSRCYHIFLFIINSYNKPSKMEMFWSVWEVILHLVNENPWSSSTLLIRDRLEVCSLQSFLKPLPQRFLSSHITLSGVDWFGSPPPLLCTMKLCGSDFLASLPSIRSVFWPWWVNLFMCKGDGEHFKEPVSTVLFSGSVRAAVPRQ